MDDEYWAQFPDVLSIADLARITRISHTTAWRWLGRGIVPGHQFGEAWIVYKEEVRRKLEDRESQPRLPQGLLGRYPDELDAKALSELVGKSRETIYGWLHLGILPGRQLDGRAWLLYKAEFRDALERSSNQHNGVAQSASAAIFRD